MRIIILFVIAMRFAHAADEGRFVVSAPHGDIELVFIGKHERFKTELINTKLLGKTAIIEVATEEGYSAIGTGERFTWTTDKWVFGSIDGKRAVLNMPCENTLESWGKRFFLSRGWKLINAGVEREPPLNRFDAGGNILVTPPIGKTYPDGLIVIGKSMQKPVKDFFVKQGMQTTNKGKLIEIETEWLKVGHVDEIVSFLTVPTTQKMVVVLPDPLEGVRLLKKVPYAATLFSDSKRKSIRGKITNSGPRFIEDASRNFSGLSYKHIRIVSGKGMGLIAEVVSMAGNRINIGGSWNMEATSVFHSFAMGKNMGVERMPVWFTIPDLTSSYHLVEESKMWVDASGEPFPAFITAGEIAGDSFLLNAAEFADRKIYGPNGLLSVLTKELSLDGSSIIRLPVLMCDNGNRGDYFFFVPNPVNLLAINGTVLMLKPFGPRTDETKPETDVFEQAWKQKLTHYGFSVKFIDGWNELHRHDGGVHCGVNALRKL